MGRTRATTCKKCGAAREAKREALCRPCMRTVQAERDRKKLYRLTPERFEQMMREQRGRCMICRRRFSDLGGHRVDHSHDTGDVRALLCNGCNVGLGHFCDNPVYLGRAIAYLARFVRKNKESNHKETGSKIEKVKVTRQKNKKKNREKGKI